MDLAWLQTGRINISTQPYPSTLSLTPSENIVIQTTHIRKVSQLFECLSNIFVRLLITY